MKGNDAQWWLVAAIALLIVFVWPPQNDKSLATKVLNWSVDPMGRLPVLPDQLPLGQGDDPEAVNVHDAQVQRYDELYLQGGWMRKRLELKVVGDPFNPSTVRQLLTGAAALTALFAWRLGSRKT
jgi:hypothetical protein